MFLFFRLLLVLCVSLPIQSFAGYDWCTPASSDAWQMQQLCQISEQKLDPNECGREVAEWIRKNHLIWLRVYQEGVPHRDLPGLDRGYIPLKIKRTWRAQVPIPVAGMTYPARLGKAFHDCIVMELDCGKWGAIQKRNDGLVQCEVFDSSIDAIKRSHDVVGDARIHDIGINRSCTLKCTPGRKVSLGELETYVKDMDRIYYDLTLHNCWHLCDRVEMFLVAAGMRHQGKDETNHSWEEIWENQLPEKGFDVGDFISKAPFVAAIEDAANGDVGGVVLDLIPGVNVVRAVQRGGCEIQ